MELFGHFTIFFLQGVGGGGLQTAALGEENGEETPAWAQNFNIAQIAQQGCQIPRQHSLTWILKLSYLLVICLFHYFNISKSRRQISPLASGQGRMDRQDQ